MNGPKLRDENGELVTKRQLEARAREARAKAKAEKVFHETLERLRSVDKNQLVRKPSGRPFDKSF